MATSAPTCIPSRPYSYLYPYPTPYDPTHMCPYPPNANRQSLTTSLTISLTIALTTNVTQIANPFTTLPLASFPALFP